MHPPHGPPQPGPPPPMNTHQGPPPPQQHQQHMRPTGPPQHHHHTGGGYYRHPMQQHPGYPPLPHSSQQSIPPSGSYMHDPQSHPHYYQQPMQTGSAPPCQNRNIWLRFGLTISLTKSAPHSALQAFKECMRIDQDDPLPAMLAAKLLLEDLDEPEQGLDVANESISRCKRCKVPKTTEGCEPKVAEGDTTTLPMAKSSDSFHQVANGNSNLASGPTEDQAGSSSSTLSQSSISPKSRQQLTDKSQQREQQQQQKHNDENDKQPSSPPPLPQYLASACCYKNIDPLLSKCYLLASLSHAQIYEREPESIKQFKVDHLKESLSLLDLAIETNPDDHLAYFHKALHQVKQRTYPKAIDNLRRAIQISPHHIPSMQLLILTLSALKLNEEALVLCESALHEFEDDLLLLYFKCNLEQRLVGTKGYKVALSTAQHMLRSLQRSSETKDRNNNDFEFNRNHSSTTTISAAAQSLQNQQNQVQQQQQAQQSLQQQHQQTPSSQQNNHNPQQQPQSQQQPQEQHELRNNQTRQLINQQAGQNSLQQPQSQPPQQQQQQQQLQQQTQKLSSSTNAIANSTNSHNNSQLAIAASPKVLPLQTSPGKQGGGDSKQANNLFADDASERPMRHRVIDGELSIWLMVAEIFVKVGSLDDAEMCIDEAASHASGALSHRIMFVRGLVAKARNNLIEAKTFFQSCLALCPRHAMALQQVAHVYYQVGQYAIAEKFLRDSLDLDGDCFKTWHYLSLVLTELNQPEKANECAKKSTVLEESSPVVAFSTIPRLTLQ